MANAIYQRADAYLEQHRDRFLEDLFNLVRQPSISARREGTQECAELVAAMMESSGFASRLIPTAGLPIVYGEVVNPGAPKVLVYGHYDVQAPEPLSEWISPPFAPEVRNGKIYGRGTSDNKAQFLIYLKAAEVLKAVTGAVPVNLKILIEGEEEIGSPSLEPFIRDHLDLLSADLTLFSDGHTHKSGRPTVTLGVKGMLYVELIARGAATDHHSMHAASIVNPAWRLIWALNALKTPDGLVRIPGFYDDVRAPDGESAAAIRAIPDDDEAELKRAFGVDDLLTGRVEDGYYWNLLTEPTCNIAGLTSGYGGEGSKTVLPSTAVAKLDLRLVPDQQPEKVLEGLRAHFASCGLQDIEIKLLHHTIPSTTPIDHPALSVMIDALRDAYGREPVVYPRMGGVGPNYVFTDILRQPCFGLPHATFDQANHSPNESMDLDGFFNGIRAAIRILYRLPEELQR